MWRNTKQGNFYNPKIGLGTPVDCKWGEWNEWGSCTSLGTSYPPCYQTHTRKMIQEARNGGKDCRDTTGKLKVKSKTEIEKKECKTEICDNLKTVKSCQQQGSDYTELKCDDTAEAIQIESVFYGMRPWNNENDNGANPTCVKDRGCNIWQQGCDAGSYAKDWVQFQWTKPDGSSRKVVGAGCEGANYCRFQVNHDMEARTDKKGDGSFCHKCHTFAEIKYRCVRTGTHHNKRVHEDANFKAQCPVGEVISVQNPIIFKSYFCDNDPLEQGAAYEALNQE